MKINVSYDREKKERVVNVANNSLVRDLLEKMKINPVVVIVSKNGAIIPEDEKLKANDKIMIISVISGG